MSPVLGQGPSEHGDHSVGDTALEGGKLLDGHHRLRAVNELRAAGVAVPDPRVEVARGLTEEQKQDLVVALNLFRRHLTPEERRQVLAHLRAQGWSLREIAGKARVSKDTVARDLAQHRDQVSHVATPARVKGKDGKSYPARAKAPAAHGRVKVGETTNARSPALPAALPARAGGLFGECPECRRPLPAPESWRRRWKRLREEIRNTAGRVQGAGFELSVSADDVIALYRKDPDNVRLLLDILSDFRQLCDRILTATAYCPDRALTTVETVPPDDEVGA